MIWFGVMSASSLSISVKVFSKTPAHKPRQPAWATPITSPAGLLKNIGKQSAVITANTSLA